MFQITTIDDSLPTIFFGDFTRILWELILANIAEELAGRVLEGNWMVGPKAETSKEQTGGNFSIGYQVINNDGRKGFLKVLDFSRAFSCADPVEAMATLTNFFNFERELLTRCKDAKMSRVVVAIAQGNYTEEGEQIPVPYIIFEFAESDIRRESISKKKPELSQVLMSLRHIATGIGQLHKNGIAHQDLKPSNILLFENKGTKIADLGRSSIQGSHGPFDHLNVPGDPGYAPPEQRYGHIETSWGPRRFAGDLYLFGSLVVFMFTGANLTLLLEQKITTGHSWREWSGSWNEVLPYLRRAHNEVIEEIKDSFPEFLRDELVQAVRQLCEPDPNARGHDIAKARGVPYSMIWFVSLFDKLSKRAAIKLRKQK